MSAKKSDKEKTGKTLPDTDVSAAQAPNNSPAANFPIVGIGASAGGLAAFEAFFSGMPTEVDTGMAFVLVQHLAPDHKSILTELIRRYTRMEVFEVVDGMQVRPNCAYIIPPNRDMAFLNGALQLLEPSAPRGQRMPIDFFFRSLALDQRERAIGIVLSGTGSDGTLGVRAIKGEGGMTIAQAPSSTEYDGMPNSAIAMDLIDYELLPAEMPAKLIAYVAQAFGKPHQSVLTSEPKFEGVLKKIFVLLRAQTGHDFSLYKSSTIHRRVERRMAVHQIESLEDYVKYLQQTPVEVEALFRDLLIGVTNFFRDTEAFQVIEELVVPKMLAAKSTGTPIRVWIPGCSTGEEAYSLAILLREHIESLKQSLKVQIFATDIDGQAITTARAGLYPASIVADISAERLARFFTLETDGSTYRIHKSIRDMVVFSEQDVIKDPPFSRLDLISCRNLLIYMTGDLQKKLIPLFHYALSPGGVLFLGSSESVGDFGDLFAVLDRKHKLYRRRENLHSTPRSSISHFVPPAAGLDMAPPVATRKAAAPAKLPLRELTEQALLKQLAPASALVNARGDILYLYGRTGMYLEPAPGEASINNVLKMAREGLRRALTTALRKAVASGETVSCPNLRVKTNGHFSATNLTVCPVTTGLDTLAGEALYLVILEEAPALVPPANPQVSNPETDDGACIAELRQELQAKEDYLQAANEELETSNEELKSSNEELQSVNEEMQSTNEELETSKEELQSVNEELATVNAELQTKVSELSRANNDLNNLLAGTDIGTVFVDHRLNILRFTPAVTRIINLIQGDVGRPVGHVLSNLINYNSLVDDIRSVLDKLISKDLEVQTLAGEWYTMRILPYRTLNNVVEGAVITFIDITDSKRTREALRESEQKLSTLFDLLPLGISVLNADSQIVYLNSALMQILGITHDGLLRGDYHQRTYLQGDGTPLPPEESIGIRAMHEQRAIYNVEAGVIKENGTLVWLNESVMPVSFSDWKAIVVTTDITATKLANETRQKNENQLWAALRASSVMVCNQDLDLRYTWIYDPKSMCTLGQLLGKTDADLLPRDEAASLLAIKRQVLQSGVGTRQNVRLSLNAQALEIDLTVEPLRGADGIIMGITSVLLQETAPTTT